MKIYPNTTLTWPDPADAPNSEEPTLNGAHITYHGNRLTIRKRAESGRKEAVDTLVNATMKGAGTTTTVTGQSLFMMDHVGLSPDDAEVTVVFDGGASKCLTC